MFIPLRLTFLTINNKPLETTVAYEGRDMGETVGNNLKQEMYLEYMWKGTLRL